MHINQKTAVQPSIQAPQGFDKNKLNADFMQFLKDTDMLNREFTPKERKDVPAKKEATVEDKKVAPKENNVVRKAEKTAPKKAEKSTADVKSKDVKAPVVSEEVTVSEVQVVTADIVAQEIVAESEVAVKLNPEDIAVIPQVEFDAVPVNEIPKGEIFAQPVDKNAASVDNIIVADSAEAEMPELSAIPNVPEKGIRQLVNSEADIELPLEVKGDDFGKVLADAVNNSTIKTAVTTAVKVDAPQEEIILPEMNEQEKVISEMLGKNSSNIKISVDVKEAPRVSTPVSGEVNVALANAKTSETEVKADTESKSNVKVAQENNIKVNHSAVKAIEANAPKMEGFRAAISQQGEEATFINNQEVNVKAKSESNLPLEMAGNVEPAETINKETDMLFMDKLYSSAKAVRGEKVITPANYRVATKVVVDQIKVEIKKAPALDKIVVKLKPRELGNIEIKVEVADGKMQASIQADKKETLELLQKDVKALEKALQDAGMKTEGSNSFNFSLKGGDQQRADANQQHNAKGNNNHAKSGEKNDSAEADNAEEKGYVRAGISIKV